MKFFLFKEGKIIVVNICFINDGVVFIVLCLKKFI